MSTARRAWAALAEGHRSGDFACYVAMLSHNYSFSVTVGPFRGLNKGKKRAQAYLDAIAAKPNLTYRAPLRICAAEKTVVIEFDDVGDFGGVPYRNRVATKFDVEDGQVTAYREYFGDVDLDIINLIVAADSKVETSS